MSQRLTLLGSTGSIGQSTLDVVRQLGERFSVYALVAGRNTDALVAQITEFRPAVVVVEAEATRDELRGKLKASGLRESFWTDLEFGPVARVAVAAAPEVDFVMSAIVGVAGLEATYAAIATGKKIGLANKEVLVASGALVMDAVKATGVEMIPVDSEHNGAHQCLRAGERGEALRLILTASGGPFRNTPAADFEGITVAQALKHPTWKMGSRITIDSATMMNKGFEVIEACWLFGFTPDEVDVVVHPTSSVHAMVEYSDGSVMAQISTTDMRMPIQYAMTWPARMKAPVPRMDWTQPRTMEFFPPDLKKFRALQLAYDAQRTGGSATCTLNAADEIAVDAFLNERISFPGIARVVEETLQAVPVRTPRTIGEVLEIDQESRRAAAGIVERQVAAVRA
jgi:1-deoxy-D-xylulose-5-phosphate reductoisomerase